MNTFLPPDGSAAATPVHLDTELALSQIGDLDAVRSMLAMLDETLTRDVAHVAALLAQGDTAAANVILHPLKGFLPIFCRPALCHAVETVEGLTRQADAQAARLAYAELAPALQQLQAEVIHYLHGH